MSVQPRKALMKNVVARPETYGKKVGKVLPFSPSVSSFLAAAKTSGGAALAKDTRPWTDHGRYRAMSISHPAYRPPAKVGEFFANLFTTISANTGHNLDLHDLWHGHLVKPWDKMSTCILFHAKEYPNDIPVEGPPVSFRPNWGVAVAEGPSSRLDRGVHAAGPVARSRSRETCARLHQYPKADLAAGRSSHVPRRRPTSP